MEPLIEILSKLISRLSFFIRKYSDRPKVLSVIILVILLPTVLTPILMWSRFSQNAALLFYTGDLATSIIIFSGALVGFICGTVIILIILGIIESEQGLGKYALIVMVVVLILIVILALLGPQR